MSSKLDEVLSEHKEVFQEELGVFKNVKATLHVRPDTTPKFCKPRSVLFALREPIEKELDRLVQQGVLEKVEYSEWAAPIVAVMKPDGNVRICGDYKVTINQYLEVDKHPLPKAEDLFVELSGGGGKFSKLDLKNAHNQIMLDDNCREFVTINTHEGLFRPTRLPYGVASASAIFQSKMEQLLQEIPMVVCLVDDILVSGQDDASHLAHLNEVLSRLRAANLRLRLDKCTFLQPSAEYLGYLINAQGLYTTDKKVAAIAAAPTPQNVQELRSFLGMLNYYSKFVKNYSMIAQPLTQLLQKGVDWKWTSKQTDAFKQLKQLIVSAPVLTHYDPKLPVVLDADASAYGIGAVISHIFPNGEERPIAFSSWTLSKAERGYAQVEREALGIIYGVKKFHLYLFGKKFKIRTDHKALTTILGPKTGIPTLAAERLQRWAMFFTAHDYEVEFRPTHKHGNAGRLSRLLLHTNSTEPTKPSINMLQIGAMPVTAEHLKHATNSDPVLSRVLSYTMTGWPKQVDPELHAYYARQNEITVEDAVGHACDCASQTSMLSVKRIASHTPRDCAYEVINTHTCLVASHGS